MRQRHILLYICFCSSQIDLKTRFSSTYAKIFFCLLWSWSPNTPPLASPFRSHHQLKSLPTTAIHTYRKINNPFIKKKKKKTSSQRLLPLTALTLRVNLLISSAAVSRTDVFALLSAQACLLEGQSVPLRKLNVLKKLAGYVRNRPWSQTDLILCFGSPTSAHVVCNNNMNRSFNQPGSESEPFVTSRRVNLPEQFVKESEASERSKFREFFCWFGSSTWMRMLCSAELRARSGEEVGVWWVWSYTTSYLHIPKNYVSIKKRKDTDGVTHRSSSSLGSFLLMTASSLFVNIWKAKEEKTEPYISFKQGQETLTSPCPLPKLWCNHATQGRPQH